MPFLHGLPRLVCALGGLALVGCYSPYRYAPYSPYSPGIPMYSPQAAPVPQFGPPVGSPTLVNPNGGFPPADGSFAPSNGSGTQFNNGGLTPTPDPNSSFPPSNSDGFSPTLPPSNSGGGLVPNYGDPDTLPRPNSGTFGDENVTPFNQDGAAFRRDSDASQSVGSTGMQALPPGSQVQLAAHQTSPSAPISVGMNNGQGGGKAPDPYGYDSTGYRWLKGIVDFDEQQKVWVLIYDMTPDAQDVYKGQISLIQSPLLAKLQNDDVIVVEGRIDPAVRDPRTGKPQYRVETLHGPLVPATPRSGLPSFLLEGFWVNYLKFDGTIFSLEDGFDDFCSRGELADVFVTSS